MSDLNVSVKTRPLTRCNKSKYCDSWVCMW